MMTLIVAAAALALAGLAVWLYSYAAGRERSEEAMARLRGTEETSLPSRLDAPELAIPGVRWVSTTLWRAGSDVSPRSAALYLLGAIVVLVLVAVVCTPILFGGLIDLGLVMLVLFILSRRAASRRALIIEQLPGLLENLIRILSAGNSLEESIGSAAKEAPDPIRPLFESVGRQVRLGAPVDQVLAEMGEIYGLRDLRVMSLAANINRRYGGSLRNVLKSLINAIRQRAMARRELQALTGETRFSAFVLAIVPIGLTGWIYLNNRAYYTAMYHDKVGFWMMIVAAGLQITGAILLYRMVNSIGDEE